jgi:DNA polymerase V
MEILKAKNKTKLKLPLYTSPVSAGFPSPASENIEKKLDLNLYLIQHPEATFFVRVDGESMIDAGINSGDLLIVDRSLEAKNNDIVLAVIDGEFTVKRLKFKDGKVFLKPENENFKEIEITESMSFEVWGVVASVIRELRSL